MKTTKSIKRAFATRIVLVCCLLMSINHASAQTGYWDVIMLKTAEVVRGTITDSIPGTSVTILVGDTLSRTIARNDIRLITAEARRSANSQKTKESSQTHSSKRPVHYQGMMAVGFGKKLKSDNTLKVNFINGIGSEAVSFGVGVGARKPLDTEGIVMPLFLDFRIRPFKTKVSPLLLWVPD